MKAIETRYKGYRFRSRLEARWAVFFDAAGILWDYETEGYVLDGGAGCYLPDFRLREVLMGLVCYAPALEDRCAVAGTTEEALAEALHSQCELPEDHIILTLDSRFVGWLEIKALGCLTIPEAEKVAAFSQGKSRVNEVVLSASGTPFDARMTWVNVSDDGTYSLAKAAFVAVKNGSAYLMMQGIGCEDSHFWDTVKELMQPAIAQGMLAARSARFEHGEKG